MQSPSSLIFLVLLGVWAAYFVQYWVRRRDHLATARSVEQFSAAMRVLERRDPVPRADLSEPTPRSYAVHPARTVRPQVLVKRAEAAHPAAAGVTERVPVEAGDPARQRAESTASRNAGPARVRAPKGVPATADAAHSLGVATRPTPRGRVRPSRRLRGLLFLSALIGLAVVGALVALALLPLWALAPAGVAAVAAFLWVRSGVRAEAAMARARRQAARARRAALARATSGSSTVSATVRGAGHRDVEPAHEVQRSVGVHRQDAAVRGRSDDVDVPTPTRADAVWATAEPADASPQTVRQSVPEPRAEAVAVPSDDVMVPIMDDDDIPLTWDPVPVPRPTYTMKARAQRPEVEPAAVTPGPAPVARDTEGDATAYEQERRVAGA